MFQGYYNLTSEILSQNRNLNVISNNMANVTTAGFKSDKFIATTFREELLYRSGNKEKSDPTPIGVTARIRTADETVTDYTQGSFEPSTSPLDFALSDKGFFCIQTNDGTVYTRNGSFTIDDEGYLNLPTIGRVLGENGPIRTGTDKIQADSEGNIYSEDGNQFYGKLSIVDFNDYHADLNKTTGNVFTAVGNPMPVNTKIMWKVKERSNVDAAAEMVTMMSSQRALQSAAQMLRSYDVLMGKIVSQLGPV